MSQFTFTPAEDLLVLNCVRAKAAQYLSAYGVEDADLVALMAKIESQFTPVVEAPVVEEAPVAAKSKKAKTEEAESAAEEVVVEETPAAE